MIYTLYIDEAGDEGFGKLKLANKGGQSLWFAVGGILVDEDNDKLLPKWRDEINKRISPENKKRYLHFKNLRHEQKIVACQMLAEKDLYSFVVFINKEDAINSNMGNDLKAKYMMYNVIANSLIGGIALNLDKADKTAKLKIVFSRRKGTDYDFLKEMLCKSIDLYEPSQIEFLSRLIDIDLISDDSHEKRAGLQLADIATSGYFAALEPNFYGNTEKGYAAALKKTLITGFGYSIIPNQIIDFE